MTSPSSRPDRPTDAGTPTWVKVSGLLLAVAVVLIAVMLLAGHGPGRHLHGGMRGIHGSASSVVTGR